MKRTPKTSRTQTRHCPAWAATLNKLKRSVAGALVVTLSLVALAFFSNSSMSTTWLRSEVVNTAVKTEIDKIKKKYDVDCLKGAAGWEEACRAAINALDKLQQPTAIKALRNNYEQKLHTTTNTGGQPTTASLQSSSTSLPVTLIPQDGSIIGGDKGKCKDVVKHFSDGQFQIWELPCYVQYLSEVALYFAGGISVLFVIIGGYKYMIGSISDDKEGGKKTLQYALTGFTITLLAWTIVNVWQVYVTTGEREGRPAAEYSGAEVMSVDAPGEKVPEAKSDIEIPVGALQQDCPTGGKFDLVMAYIVANEGAKNNKYVINGNPTIGVGHDCKTNPHKICAKDSITNAEMLELYIADYKDHVERAAKAVAGFGSLDPVRQAVIIDLTFNQGGGWAKKFPRFIEALSTKNYVEAYNELTLNGAKNGDSLYLKQVGARARRNAELIKLGPNGGIAIIEKQAKANKLGVQMLCSGKQAQSTSDTTNPTAE